MFGTALARGKQLKAPSRLLFFYLPDNIFPDDLDLGQTIQIPRFGTGQKVVGRYKIGSNTIALLCR